MRLYHFLLILFLLVYAAGERLGAQGSFSFRQYDVEDGLPSSNLYDIVQDQRGFIWIASQGGVCRFDGKTFEKEPIRELGNAEIIKLYADSRDNLWLIDLASNVSVLSRDSLVRLSQHPSLRGKDIRKVAEDKNGGYWLYGNNEDEVAYLQGRKSLDSVDLHYKNDNLSGHKLFLSFNDTLQMFISRKGINQFRKLKLETKSFDRDKLGPGPYQSVQIRDSILLATPHQIYEFSRWRLGLDPVYTQLEGLLTSGIVSLFKDPQNNLWIGTKDGLVFLPEGDRNRAERFLPGRFINGIIQDHEGGYWFSTRKEGLYYLPSLQIKTYQTRGKSNHATALCIGTQKEVLIGYDDAYVHLLDSNLLLQKRWRVDPSSNEVYAILRDQAAHYYILHSLKLQVLNSRFRLIRERYASLKTGYTIRPGELYVGTNNLAARFIVQNNTLDTLLEERTYSILPEHDNRIWIGTTSGLYLYRNGQAVLVEEPLLQQDIRDLKMAKDSTLWIATQGDGLILYKEGKIVQHFTTELGLASNNCKKILFDESDSLSSESYAWLATNKGIHKISLADLSLTTITVDNGLPSNEINDLAKIENTILAATNGGLAIFKDDFEVFSAPPLLQFTKVSFKEIEAPIKPAYEVSYEENDVNIEFSAIAFQQSDEIEYQYLLSPLNENWIQTSANLAQFQSLDPGSYTFKVRTRTINSSWSPEKTIDFTIATPFWQRPLFLFFCAALGLFLLYRIFAFIWNDVRARKEIKEKLKASQMTALRAQMDPHFLFNSLNSIQEFIMLQDKRAANRYLTRFSRLMRNILNMSDMDEVKLKQEIESLDLYLSLEALRFEENFEYEFEIDPAIDPENISIPPMLIQPYVENAVKHGLMHKKDEVRRLWIRFRLKDHMLICEIEDNGVGRQASREIQKRDQRIYASRGMKITKQRLKLLNDAYDNQLSVRIDDLEDANGIATGTKVVLFVSLDYF